MLNREENEIMRAVYELCGGKGCCLVSPYDLMSLLPAKRGYTAERVDRLLRSLELDDYFDLLDPASACRCGAASPSRSGFRWRAR